MSVTIDYNHLLQQYKKLGLGNLDEFCQSYTFAVHIGQKFDSMESRNDMLVKIQKHLSSLKLDEAII